jgi:hypothetical protein
MKKKRAHAPSAGDSQFIPGIYNYCDRWCERCPFTARCMTFAMEQEEEKASGAKPADRAAFWKKLEESLTLTREMLSDLAEAHGVKLDPAELKAIGREERQKRRATEQHPLALAALQYSRLADDWFKSGEGTLRAKEDEVLAQAKLGVAGVNEEVASLTDVVEILRWYQHQIYVKLMRGLNADKEHEASSEFPKDSDGSVKVALIGLDRSISAWLRMKDFFPEKTDSVLTMLVHLDRLRRSAEAEFPKARSFVRPGFDTNE